MKNFHPPLSNCYFFCQLGTTHLSLSNLTSCCILFLKGGGTCLPHHHCVNLFPQMRNIEPARKTERCCGSFKPLCSLFPGPSRAVTVLLAKNSPTKHHYRIVQNRPITHFTGIFKGVLLKAVSYSFL